MLSEYPEVLTTDEAAEVLRVGLPSMTCCNPANSKPTEMAVSGKFQKNPSSNIS